MDEFVGYTVAVAVICFGIGYARGYVRGKRSR